MAIKYKFLKQKKKDTPVEDVKDRIITKQGHIVFFTLNQMENNENALRRDKEKIAETLAPIEVWYAENPSEYTEEQQNTIMMYREAELRLEGDQRTLERDEEPLTEKEITEIKSNIEYNKAVLENIKHFHPFVLDITGEIADKVSEYRKNFIAIKQYKDKLAEIDEKLRNSEIEKKAIYEQLQLNG